MSLILGEKNKKKYSGQSKFLPGKRKGISLLKVEVMAKYNYAAHNLKLSSCGQLQHPEETIRDSQTMACTDLPWGLYFVQTLLYMPSNTGFPAHWVHCLSSALPANSSNDLCHANMPQESSVCSAPHPTPVSSTAWEQGERTLNGMNEFFWEPDGAADVPVHCRGVGHTALKATSNSGDSWISDSVNFIPCSFRVAHSAMCDSVYDSVKWHF